MGLFHLNQDRSDEQMDEIVEKCLKIIKKRGSKMECFGVASDMVIDL
jgi:hypothetical protein